MSNAEKVHEFLNDAKVFYFLTTDGDQPKGRPFGFQMLHDGKVYFGCGTFKNVYKQFSENPKVEVVALQGDTWLRYDGVVAVDKSDEAQVAAKAAAPEIMAMYEQNDWEMCLFSLDHGHAQIIKMMEVIEEFDV